MVRSYVRYLMPDLEFDITIETEHDTGMGSRLAPLFINEKGTSGDHQELRGVLHPLEAFNYARRAGTSHQKLIKPAENLQGRPDSTSDIDVVLDDIIHGLPSVSKFLQPC
jgi:hypothetical protein